MRISDWSSDVCSSDLPGAATMPPIDGIGASSAGAAVFQPRPPQSSAQNSGDETRGLSIQQYLQAGQQAGQDQGVQTQTAGAVVQAASAEQSQRNNQPAANDSSATVLTLTQTLNRLSNVGSARPESASQPETSQPRPDRRREGKEGGGKVR